MHTAGSCCSYVERRRATYLRIVKSAGVALGGYLLTAGILVIFDMLHVIGNLTVFWILLGSLVAACIGYLELVRSSRPHLAWRTLGSSDAFQIASFPIFCAVSWRDALKDELHGLGLLVAVIVATVATCLIASEFILRLPASVSKLRNMIFGPLTEEGWKFEYEARRHELFCLAGADEGKRKKIRRRAYVAALRRKAMRTPGHMAYAIFFRVDKYALAPMEDTSLWLAAYTISAATMPILVQDVQPGPLGAQLLLAPIILMSPVDFIWKKVKGS